MSIENVFRQLADPKKRVNTRQVYSLSQISEKDLAAFRKWWPTVDVARRLSLLRQMVDVTEDSFEVNFDPIFLLALGDEDGQVRATAIEGLWENRDVSLVAPLLYLLNEDKEERVRAEAASALDRFILLGEMDEIEPTLRDRIEDALLSVIRNDEEPNEVRRRAVEAIAYSGRPNIRQIITDTEFFQTEADFITELKKYKKNLDDILAAGTPVYITEIGLLSNNTGFFQLFLKKYFDLTPVGAAPFEVWHRSCIKQTIISVKLYKITKKIPKP